MRLSILNFFCLGIISSLCFPTLAAAQSVSGTAAASQAGRAEQQVRHHISGKNNVSAIDVAGKIIESAPKGADRIKFVLDHLFLEGVTAYRDEDLEDIYSGYLGYKITLTDLYTIAAALQQKYIDDGYLLARVSVPSRPVSKGTAHLVIHEGYIDRVSVNGVSNPHTLSVISGYMAKVAGSGQALNTAELEKAMLITNDIPGIDARARLIPSLANADAYDLEVDADYKRYDAALSLDNYGTRYLGPLQLSAEAAMNGVLGYDERIDLQAVVAPDFHSTPELYYLGLDYQQPIFDRGTILEIFGNNDYVSPGYNVRAFDAHGRAWHTGVTLIQPFIRAHDANLKGHFTFDVRNTANWDNTFSTQHDRIRTLRAGLQGNYQDSWFNRAAQSGMAFELTQGVDILNATNENDITSHSAARPVFTKIVAEMQRLQNLFGTVDLLAGLSGQWANKSLYSAEEFGVGGSSYGRGYYFSDILGDRGIAAKLELQWNRPATFDWFDHYQLYTFIDGGKIWNSRRDVDQPRSGQLLSTGVGFRTTLTNAVDADFMIAQPINRDVPAERDRNPRVLFSLTKHF